MTGGGRERVKMKPPWLVTAVHLKGYRSSLAACKPGCSCYHKHTPCPPPNCCYCCSLQRTTPASRFQPVIRAAALATLVILVAIVCDQSKLVSSLRVHTAAANSGQAVATIRPPDLMLLIKQAGDNGSGEPDTPVGPLPTAASGLTTVEIRQTQGGAQQPLATAHFNLNNMSRVVYASSYQTEVYLPCQILNLDEDQTVSWIRKRDSLVLTVDKMRLVDDARFELNQAQDDWTLVLSQPNELDAGIYECQVSSMEPKLSYLVELRMVRAESSISNFSSLYVRPNDLVNLTCSIEAPQATSYVYWYKNKEVVHFDNLRLARAGRRKSKRQLETGTQNHPSSSVAGDKRHNPRHRTRRAPIAPLASRPVGSAIDQHQHREPAPTKPVRVTSSLRRTNSSWAASTRQQQQLQEKQDQLDEEETGFVMVANNTNNNSNSNNNNNDNDNDNDKEKEEKVQWSRASSTLIIRAAQLNDTANYTCLPSNAKPSQIRVVVIENGLGSQPEKRSLQADSASALIISPHLTWLKVRSLLVFLPATLGEHQFEFGCSIRDTGNTVEHNHAKSFSSHIYDILSDSNILAWTTSIVSAVYIMS